MPGSPGRLPGGAKGLWGPDWGGPGGVRESSQGPPGGVLGAHADFTAKMIKKMLSQGAISGGGQEGRIRAFT